MVFSIAASCTKACKALIFLLADCNAACNKSYAARSNSCEQAVEGGVVVMEGSAGDGEQMLSACDDADEVARAVSSWGSAAVGLAEDVYGSPSR